MKYLGNILIGILLLTGLQSCKNTVNDEDKELDVLNEIFAELAEKLGASDYKYLPPPPPMPIVDDDFNIIGYDTTGYKKLVADFEKETEILKDDTTVVIAIVDSLSTYDSHKEYKSFKGQLPSVEYIEALDAMTDSFITSCPLDLDKIKNRGGFVLKYYSEFPQGMDIWERENYDFFLSGVMNFSRIYFDRSGQFGLIYCAFMCGRLCGNGAIVCIRKVNDKWMIEKTIELWVS